MRPNGGDGEKKEETALAAAPGAGASGGGGGGGDGKETYTLRLCNKEDFLQELACRNFLAEGQLSFGRVNWVRAFACCRFDAVPVPVWVAWRVLVGAFGIAVFVWDIAGSSPGGLEVWEIYLTHWLLTLSMITMVSTAICTVMAHYVWGIDSDIWRERRCVPTVVRAAWIGNVMSNPGGLIVVAVFWAVLAGPSDRSSAINYFAHGFVWAAITLDHLLGQQPYILLHTAWVTLIAFIYAIWSIIFCSAGLYNTDTNKPYIYKILDWNNAPKAAAVYAFVLSLVAIPLVSIFYWTLNACRRQAIVRGQGVGV